ncbi:Uncharacterized protein HZ326_18505 [Fusarium oxysporum f. sp. albedinis]|nr:Uncharacterized protein HZ326_18505 [Fusarium oxysporum f. sp. albedinis]
MHTLHRSGLRWLAFVGQFSTNISFTVANSRLTTLLQSRGHASICLFCEKGPVSPCHRKGWLTLVSISTAIPMHLANALKADSHSHIIPRSNPAETQNKIPTVKLMVMGHCFLIVTAQLSQAGIFGQIAAAEAMNKPCAVPADRRMAQTLIVLLFRIPRPWSRFLLPYDKHLLGLRQGRRPQK